MASVRLKEVYKKFSDGHTVVNDINIEIEDKELVVFVGPSGCGKTTILRMISGLEDVSSGEVYIGNKLVNNLQPKDRDIAMVFQNYALYPHMTVFDNMAFGLKLQKMPENVIENRVLDSARMLDIEHLLDRKPKILSAGQKQRVAIGRAIVREPKVFLMDEPLSNLDPKLRMQMRIQLSKLHRKLQSTIIYVTHDQNEALTIGTRVVVMKDGFIQQIDTPQSLYDNPCNMFVAGFIGTPQMNFVNAKVEREGRYVKLFLREGSINLPEFKGEYLEKLGYVGREVILGVRPENVHEYNLEVKSDENTSLEVKVDVIERLGSEAYLYMALDNVDFIAKVSSSTELKAGDIAKIIIDPNKINIFDKETERTILN